ncbi:MAG TPA: ATP-binding protein [Steroidobacteraceae bacterium]|jgi:two-component system sensor kinase FixL|nr:ATP-binding protein [Steroidobacteraceae bacterium]
MLIYDELDMKSDPQPEPGPALGVPAVLHGRLLHVSRMATIGEMAAGVAHELNQPLTAIANYAQACSRLLARPGADPAVLQQALTEITTQAARAADIIRRLRALASRQQSERAPADVNALVREMIDLVESDARLHGVNVSLELADGLPPVLVDAGQIQHVILNFVRNSLEALASRSGGGGRLAIRTWRPSAVDVEVAVIDNGPGLTSEAISRVFDPFFSTKESGTGMGLAISNTIARTHGGSVGYRPNQPSGACFYILLPAAA